MANIRKPRKGSMGVWPRKRAKRSYPRIRGWNTQKFDKTTLLGFPGYKVGMTHLMGIDNNKSSLTKGDEIFMPVTIIECPPIKIFSARFYKQNAYGAYVCRDFFFKPSKDLQRRLSIPKNIPDIKELDKINPDEYSEITAVISTQPGFAGFGKKKPDVFELKLSGSNKDKLEFIKANAEKEVGVEQAFKEAQWVDAHAITKGKGLQGPIKRFGISLKPHKSEKGVRQPGSRGPWCGQQHVMYRTAYSGQMGYHQRMQMNLQLLKIGTKPEEINPKDCFPNYGAVKSTHLLVKGSVPGAKKRMIMLTQSIRMKKELPLPTITYVSLSSKQGR